MQIIYQNMSYLTNKKESQIINYVQRMYDRDPPGATRALTVSEYTNRTL